MTLTLQLPPHTERKLRDLAAQTGQDVSDYTLTVIENHLEAHTEYAAAADGEDLLAEAVARLVSRTPDEVIEARARAAQFVRPGKPLPPGQTILDAIGGKWPGDESDEQVAEALRRLS